MFKSAADYRAEALRMRQEAERPRIPEMARELMLRIAANYERLAEVLDKPRS